MKSITDFGELPVFEAAATFPTIFVAQLGSGRKEQCRYTQVQSLNPPYPDLHSLVHSQGSELAATAIAPSGWLLVGNTGFSLIQRMKEAGQPLSSYLKIGIYSGIKSGLNSAFWIDNATKRRIVAEYDASRKVIKRLARGDDVRRWHFIDNGLNLIYTHSELDIEAYPAIKKYVAKFRHQLEARAGSQEWWQLQQSQYSNGVWDRPKIVYPYICSSSRFTFDRAKVYANMNAYIIPTDDLFLLGVLASNVVWQYLKYVCAAHAVTARWNCKRNLAAD